MQAEQTISRRDFIRTAGVGMAAVAVAQPLVRSPKARAAGGKPSLIIDCHAHIYGEDEEQYPTVLNPLRPPQATGTVLHLKEEMERAGVRYVTAIQTSTFYRWDNRFTIDASRANSDSFAAVCTLDPDNPRSPRLLERYVNDGGVRGMRSITARNGRLDDPGVDKLWAVAERLGVVINVLVGPGHVDEIEALVKRHPKLRVIIDHCLGMQPGDGLEATLAAMKRLAELSNVHAKLTFIPTGTKTPYPCSGLHDACRQVIAMFTPERCVWGSDFPCELWCPNITYSQHLRIFTHELGLDDKAKRAILGETAYRLWFEPL